MADTFNISDVMLSYSRKDSAFVKQLEHALISSGREVWVDWQDIPPTADWWAEIEAGIEAAHTFIFVISPNSVASEICHREIQHAVSHNKRLVPILYQEITDPELQPKLHPALGQHNWLFFRDTDNFDQGFQLLLRALETDLAHTRLHTRLLVKAKEWNEKARRNGYLLRGDDLREAENWFAASVGKTPAPTALQSDYIAASRRAAHRFRQVTAAAMFGTIFILALLALYALDRSNVAVAAADDARTQAQEAQNQAATANARATQVAERETAQVTFVVQIDEQRGTANYSGTQAADNIIRAQTAATAAVNSQLTANAAATSAYNIQLTADAASTDVGNIGATAQTAAANAATQAAELRLTSSFAETEAAGASTNAASAGTLAANAETQAASAGTQAANAKLQADRIATDAALTQISARSTMAAAQLTEAAANTTATHNFNLQLTAIVVNQTATGDARTALAVQTQVAQEQRRALSLRLSSDALAALAAGDRPRAMQLILLAVARPGVPNSIKSELFDTLQDIAYAMGLSYILKGHSEPIQVVAFSSDGKQIISAEARVLHQWETATGKRLSPTSGINISDHFIEAISSDGSKIAAVKSPDTITVFNAANGEILFEGFAGVGQTVTDISFNRDGTRIAVAGLDTIRIWDIYPVSPPVPEPIQTFEFGALQIALSPDGKSIVINKFNEGIQLWNVDELSNDFGKLIQQFSGNPTTVYDLQYSPLGTFVFSFDNQYGTRIWEPYTGYLRQLVASTGEVTSIAVNQDESLFAIGTRDGDINLFDMSSYHVISTFKGHTKSVSSLAFSPNNKILISGSADQAIRIWDIVSGQQIAHSIEADTFDVYSVDFDPTGKRLITSGSEPYIRIWNTDEKSAQFGTVAKQFEQSLYKTVTFSPDGKRAVTGDRFKSLRLWNTDATDNEYGSLIHEFSSPMPYVSVSSISFSADGSRMVTINDSGIIKIWDLNNFQLIDRPFQNDGHVWNSAANVVFNPNTPIKRFISGGDFDEILIWNADEQDNEFGSIVQTIPGYDSFTSALAYSPDGDYILSGSSDFLIHLIDLNDATDDLQFTGHFDTISDLEFTPNGRYAMSSSIDGTLRLWDIASGQQIGTPFIGHSGFVRSLSISPDGTRVASGGTDGTIRLWAIRNFSQTRRFVCENRVIGMIPTAELEAKYGLKKNYTCPGIPATFVQLEDAVALPQDVPQPPLVLDNGVGALRGIVEPPLMPTPTLVMTANGAISGERLLGVPVAPMTATATPEWMPTVSP